MSQLCLAVAAEVCIMGGGNIRGNMDYAAAQVIDFL